MGHRCTSVAGRSADPMMQWPSGAMDLHLDNRRWPNKKIQKPLDHAWKASFWPILAYPCLSV